jgi:hypothetical protein
MTCRFAFLREIAWQPIGQSRFKLNDYALKLTGLAVDAKGRMVLDPT